ncbi:MAG: sterol desaturase family protein [Deltaproteobacteria bacterium]|nr:sterol desaturase family protein [Deltaproteobacteria bacterium]MBI3391514.1 sterol desaturase family protein [Deltaproteobacteria bacterium]
MSSAEPRKFGSGWISGSASIVLGAMGLGAVLCLLFPAQLTTPELRAIYPMGIVRGLIQAGIVTGFVLGLLSIVLRKSKALGLAGLLLATIAVLLGGWEVPVEVPVAKSNYLGLDWFLLDLLLMSVLFVPIERLFPRVSQPILRDEFSTDLVYFFIGHVLIQVFVFFTVAPATAFFAWARHPSFEAAITSQPLPVQFVEIVFVSDLFFYWTHRLFHRVPFLWRAHAVHHSPRQMDWLAGSRLHILEIVIVRAVMFLPLFVCGFSASAVQAYVAFVALHAVLLHANVRFRFGWLEQIIAMPRYHQFHHASDGESLDKNFAVHLPWLDRLFGTQYLPRDGWPKHMGVAGDPLPATYWAQLVYPFRPPRASV